MNFCCHTLILISQTNSQNVRLQPNPNSNETNLPTSLWISQTPNPTKLKLFSLMQHTLNEPITVLKAQKQKVDLDLIVTLSFLLIMH